MPDFSTRFKELRNEYSLTQVDVAEILDSKVRVIAYYEKGERTPPLDKLVVLADYFNVSIDYLVGRTDDPTPVLRAASGLTEDTDMEAVERDVDKLRKAIEDKKNK